MTIDIRIREALEQGNVREQKSDSLIRLERFYAEMKEKGLVRQKEYSIPPLDTVGRAVFASQERPTNL